jgi:hypothetical protein
LGNRITRVSGGVVPAGDQMQQQWSRPAGKVLEKDFR